MIDVHAHIIPNIDDGSRKLEDSIRMLKDAENAGFTRILLTPHYMEHLYEVPKEKIQESFEQFKECAVKNSIDIKLFLGNEVYMTPSMPKYLYRDKFCSLNNTKYILVEIPMHEKISYLDDILNIIFKNGYIPILAHPERYGIVQNDITFLKSLVERGVLLQSNYGSLIGLYGRRAERVVKELLIKDMITFMGSDAHNTSNIYPMMGKVLKILKKYTTENQFLKITQLNAAQFLDLD